MLSDLQQEILRILTDLAEGSTFARLSVGSPDEVTYVDLASDARMLPARSTDTGFMLAEAELAADKVLALSGRGESRDFIDFRGLLTRFDMDQLCQLAGQKDPGFAPEQLVAALEYFDRIPPAEFAEYTDDYDGLRDCVHAARQSLEWLALTADVLERSHDGNTRPGAEPKSRRDQVEVLQLPHRMLPEVRADCISLGGLTLRQPYGVGFGGVVRLVHED